jgi:archaetidylinositol phosphate synthase
MDLLLPAALAGAGVVLLALTAVTARRPAQPVPDLDGYFDRWQRLHGDYDPRGSVWVRGWLRFSAVPARPLARLGVQPDVLTLWSAWLTALVLVPARAGGGWPALAGALVVVSGMADNVDGAVAAMTDRATRFGYVLDSIVDRVNDLLYLAGVVLAGGDARLAVACGAVFLFHDYTRARSGNAGGGEIAAITVAERPQRVIVLALTLVAVGVAGERWVLADAGLWAMLALAGAGYGQLLVAVRRILR